MLGNKVTQRVKNKEEKQIKKLIALLLALVMVLSLTACGGSSAPAANDAPAAKPAAPVVSESGKTVLNVWAFTDEVPNMIARYMELHPDFAEKYEIKTTIIATTDGQYQPALDQALGAGTGNWDKFYEAAVEAVRPVR